MNNENKGNKYFGKTLLSYESYNLLEKLILDLYIKLPPEKRIYNKKDNPTLIYNLFTGNYSFSYKQYKEIYNALLNLENASK